MKELTIEEKVEAYDKALERAKKYLGDCMLTRQEYAEKVFPELAESEGERIRKWLVALIKSNEYGSISNVGKMPCPKLNVLAWIEKKDEPTDINPSEFDLRLNKLLKQFETLPKEELASSLSFYLSVVQNDGTYKEEKQDEQKSDDNKGTNSMEKEMTPFQKKVFSIVDTTIEEEQGLSNICNELSALIKQEIEKQGEQSKNEDKNILYRFSFYSYKDEPNILYLAGLYVDDEHRNKGIGTKILEVADEVAKNLNCRAIRLKTKKNSIAERLYQTHGYNNLATEEKDEVWLEKQGEQKSDDKIQLGKKYKCIVSPRYSMFITGKIYKPEDKFLCKLMNFCYDCFEPIEDDEQKVEPKFKVGNWIINHCHIAHIKSIDEKNYFLSCRGDNSERPLSIDCINRNWRLWTIQDAKDGDVLANDHHILILRELGYSWTANGNPDSLYAYCGIKPNGNFELEQKGYCFCGTLHTHPATKEQCDLLFQKMKEAGYEWDAEKKELKKIEQEQVIDYPDNLPKDNWELVQEFVNKFGRIPKDEDELNVLVKYVLKKTKSLE